MGGKRRPIVFFTTAFYATLRFNDFPYRQKSDKWSTVE